VEARSRPVVDIREAEGGRIRAYTVCGGSACVGPAAHLTGWGGAVLRLALRTIWRLLWRRRPACAPPIDPADYAVHPLGQSPGLTADDIPTAHTPEGGFKEFPPRVLAGCTECLPPSAPDLRGVWRVYRGFLKGHVERVEQCGDRVVITANGVIHDMRADGTLGGGVRDVSEATGEPIAVAAGFRRGRLDLRPMGGGIAIVSRWREGPDMIWRYGFLLNRLQRLDGPEGVAEAPAGPPMVRSARDGAQHASRTK